MTFTSPRHSATPARVWLPAYGVPALAALFCFTAARISDDSAEGLWFALGLTAVVLGAAIGPIICGAWRLHALEDRHEDDTDDLAFRLRKLEAVVAELRRGAAPPPMPHLPDYLPSEWGA